MREPGSGWPFASIRSERTERAQAGILASFPGVAPPRRAERWYASASIVLYAFRHI